MKSVLILWGVLLVCLFSKNVYAKKKILITSFEAFEGRERNNSSLVSEELKRLFNSHPSLVNDYSLEILVLPVRSRAAPEKAKKYIQKMQQAPDMVLSLGESARLAQKKQTIEINFNAYNKPSSKYNFNSNNGSDAKLYPYWDERESFNYPIAQMYCALTEEDRRWIALEDSIGSYVCNETAFDLSLYLKDNATKDAQTKNLISNYEYQRKQKLTQIENASKDELKKLTDAMNIQKNKVLGIKKDIENDPYLVGQLNAYYDALERQRFEEEQRRKELEDQRRNSNYSNNSGNNFKWVSPNSPQPSTLQPAQAPTYKANINDFAPKINEYMTELGTLKSSENSYYNKYNSIQSEISTMNRSMDHAINLVKDIGNDTFRTANEPYYGFIHIPILEKSTKTNPLEIAQLIALMVRGTFEQNYKNANVNFKKGTINCGMDSRVAQSEPYKKVQDQLSEARISMRNSISVFKSKYTDKNFNFATEEEIIKIAKGYKTDPDAQNIVAQANQIEILNTHLQAVVMAAPVKNDKKDSFFKGHEKYQPQGTFTKATPSKNLLRLGFQAARNDIPLPAEIDFNIRMDSNNNVVLLLKNENGQEQIVSLQNFETAPLTLVTLSSSSSMSISLNNTKSYAKYELRDLKADGVKYNELNSRIEYWLNLDYSYPVRKLKDQTIFKTVEGPKGPEQKVEYIKVPYYVTQTARTEMLLKFVNGKWKFFIQNNPLNMLMLTVDQPQENMSYIQQIEYYDLKEVVPQPPKQQSVPAPAPPNYN